MSGGPRAAMARAVAAEEAGFDQIWTGNENLDITGTVVKELNKRYRAKKAAAKP